MNHNTISGIVNTLPIEKMVAAPVLAAVSAQTAISKGLAEYVNEVGLDSNGNLRMVTFKFSETVENPDTDTANTPTYKDRYIQAPFLALTGIPNFAMEEVNVSFDLEVSTAEDSKSTTDVNTSTEGATKGWLLPKASFKASVTHKSEQTRHTDTRAKYSFNVSARRQGPPESFMRIIDAVTSSVGKLSEATPALADNLTKDPAPNATNP